MSSDPPDSSTGGLTNGKSDSVNQASKHASNPKSHIKPHTSQKSAFEYGGNKNDQQ